ncbi:MAG TPA: S8 family serine peptidase, partial [Kofleriaceae bacterium]|nr:S8 family serine peptidase [Kofleriaceae bacterium]
MSRSRSILAALLLAATSLGTTTAAPQAAAPASPAAAGAPRKAAPAVEAPRYATDHVIVKWKDAGKGAVAARAHGLTRVKSLPGAARAELVSAKGRSVPQLVAELKGDPAVAYVEPDYYGKVSGDVSAVSVNDPLRGRQYSLDQMMVPSAWSLSKGGSQLIAVIDTGVQFGHPDLQGRVAVNAAEKNGKAGVDDDGNGFVDDVWGWDFVNDDNYPADDNNHGTWVSGIISANQNNDRGIAGISWTNQLLEVKVMAWNGYGLTSDLADGIDYAVKRGAKIINMSVGGFPNSSLLADAVARAWKSGAVLVAAAGNNRVEEISYPASFPNVISVSATQADDEFANWSSYGPYVDVAAPGTAVTTTDCGGCSPSSAGSPTYVDISGTSFATPNTAGVVALIWGRYPTMSNADVVKRLVATVDDRGFKGWDNRYGYGRVNAYRAVGGSPAPAPAQIGDGLELNQGPSTARLVSYGTFRPNIYPAGDVDYFAYDLPRPGRLEVAVTPVQDTSRLPKSQLSVDPVVEIWVNGTRVQTFDDQTSSWVTEHASYQASAAMRVVVGVRNWLPNGSKTAYSVTGAFVDNVAPTITARNPLNGTDRVAVSPVATVSFDEAVTGVSTNSFALYDPAGKVVPATVGYDSTKRQAWLRPSVELDPLTTYSLAAGSG